MSKFTEFHLLSCGGDGLFANPLEKIMVVKTLKSKEEFDTLLKSGKPFVVDFYAEWCGPCKMISPKLEALSEQAPYNTIDYVKVDVDELEELSAELGIRAMPTFFFFKDSKKVDELVGANPASLEAKIKTLVSK